MSILSNQPISSPIMIGREREVAALHALIDQVRQGQGQVLLLSGEAGIGKSRLAAEGKRIFIGAMKRAWSSCTISHADVSLTLSCSFSPTA